MTARATAPLAAILGAGLVLRLLFISSAGFHNDVAAFESWTLTLRDNPPWQFFAKAGFSEYPPGYFVILWVVAKLYALLGGDAHGGLLLRALVKLPAIVMDLVNAAVVFAIVRRYASQGVALAAAAALALNPVAIYVSAYWGQVDSVSWGFALIAVWCVLRAGDAPDKTVPRLAWAWLALAFSILIKPPAAMLVLLFLAYPFAAADAAVRARRLAATAAGIGAALALALAVGLAVPPAARTCSAGCSAATRFGSGIYPFNSVNAFNLYALRQPFWQPDTVPLSIFGIARRLARRVGRRARARRDGADRRALPAAARRARVARRRDAVRARVLRARDAHARALRLRRVPARDAADRVRPHRRLGRGRAHRDDVSEPGVLARVPDGDGGAHRGRRRDGPVAADLASRRAGERRAVLLARDTAISAPPKPPPAHAATRPSPAWSGRVARARRATRERGSTRAKGSRGMTRRDWLFAGLFTLGSFVLCVLWLQFPAEKIFDEIYYARAGEEYLRHSDVNGLWSFEFTHPPLSKLLITASMLLFGGLHGLGDTAVGWRFGNVVVGALTVGLIYVFAKRLTASTLFASLAALMLALDGFHYVQSRIATPEITVAFFSLLTLYAFYRLWVGAQIARRVPLRSRAGAIAFAATMAVGVVAAAAAWYVAPLLGPIKNGPDIIPRRAGRARGVGARAVLARGARARGAALRARRPETSYADGTRVLAEPARAP